MIKKAVAIGSLVLGSILTLLGGISVYSFSTGEPVWFPLDTVVREDWATVHQVGLLVPSVGNLVLTFSLVTILFAIGYLLLRESGKSDSNRFENSWFCVERKGSGMSIDILAHLFPSARTRDRALLQACRRYGYRLREIAAYLGVHDARVSRHFKQAEARHV